MVISEILPNPIGRDTDGEWIELQNNSVKSVNLAGWSVKDAKGKTYNFGDEVLGPGQYAVLKYQISKINLNNNGETIYLLDSSGRLKDKFEYSGSAHEGWSIVRDGGLFSQSRTPTPGEINARASTEGMFSNLSFSGAQLVNASPNRLPKFPDANIFIAAPFFAFFLGLVGLWILLKFRNENT